MEKREKGGNICRKTLQVCSSETSDAPEPTDVLIVQSILLKYEQIGSKNQALMVCCISNCV